ncbi:MAG: hypothetical protein ACREGA_02235 [Candidatus Saccharimonadales bacterium]
MKHSAKIFVSKKLPKVILGSLVFALLLVSYQNWRPARASAISTSGFKAGHIIDDNIFTNSSAMTVGQIQAFLNAKVGTCDTNGTQPSNHPNGSGGYYTHARWGAMYGNPAPFTCVNEYVENPSNGQNNFRGGGVSPNTVNAQNLASLQQKGQYKGWQSAAAIIYNTAQKYNINPEVLITTMQKEQGLVTDNWPWLSEYQKALGAGCPDTAPCDPSQAGFYNQIDAGAGDFRYYLDHGGYNYHVGNNTILYNPSSSCGSSTVNIQDLATAALYSYTPYQPNAATLAAPQGQTVTCGAYGNLNFWRYFNEWFGSSTNPLFRIKGDPTTYLNFGDTYYPIPSMKVFRAFGLGGLPISIVTTAQLQDSTRGPILSQVVKFGNNATVYLVDSGKLFSVPSLDTLARYGYSSGEVVDYSDANLQNILSSGGGLTYFIRQPNGAIYYMDSGKKHVFPDGKTFNTLGPNLSRDGTLNYANFSAEFINDIPNGGPELLDSSIVKATDSATVYLYDSGKLWTFTPDSWQDWGHKLDYSNFTSSSLTQIPSGGTAPLLITDGSTNYYLVSGGQKHSFTTATQTEWGLNDSRFQQVSTSSLARLSSGDAVGDLIRNPAGGVYIISGGKSYPIPSMRDFHGLGLSWSNVQNVDNSTINLVPASGTYAFAPNSLIRTPNGAVSLVGKNYTTYGIPSMASFDSFGFQWKNVRNYGQNILNGYTAQTLQTLVKTSDGKYYLADKGNLLSISANAYGASEYNFANIPNSTLDATILNYVPHSGSLNQFIQGSGYTVYKVANGQKRPLPNPDTFYAQGGSWNSVSHVSDDFLNTIPKGASY